MTHHGMSSNRSILLAIALGVSLICARPYTAKYQTVPVFAVVQNTSPVPPADESDFTLEGKITKQEAGKLTVSTEENIIFHVTYDEKTEVKRKDGSTGSAKDLQVGAVIDVTGKLSETGEIRSTRIEIK